jgi:hypothetical protein
MYRIIFFFSTFLLLTACSEELRQVDAAATNFYHNMQAQDYEAIKAMIYEPALQTTPWEQWEAALAANQQAYGALKSFSCTGSKYADDERGLRYQLRYEVEYEQDKKTEELIFLKADGHYQLVHYQFR